MEIEDKYMKLLGKGVYSKRLEKFGRVSSMEIVSGIGSWIQFKVFYDNFDSDNILFLNDIEIGEVQFTIITGVNGVEWERYNEEELREIKEIMGERYREDMVIYIDDEERREKIREREARNVEKLHTDLVELDKVSAEVMCGDFYSRELYLRWKRGVLGEKEFLYALVNHLSQEYKREDERNQKYFFKYEFGKEGEKALWEKVMGKEEEGKG